MTKFELECAMYLGNQVWITTDDKLTPCHVTDPGESESWLVILGRAPKVLVSNSDISQIVPIHLDVDLGVGADKRNGRANTTMNHQIISNTPVGGECTLSINGKVSKFRLEVDNTDNPYWCSEECPFRDIAPEGCPGCPDEPCSLSKDQHPSNMDLILVPIEEVAE